MRCPSLHAHMSEAISYARRYIARIFRREYQDDEKGDSHVCSTGNAYCKPDKFALLSRRLEDDVIPLLEKQTGFRDELSFVDKENDEAIAMSFRDTSRMLKTTSAISIPRYTRRCEMPLTAHRKVDYSRSITQPGTTFTLPDSGTVDKRCGGSIGCRPFSSMLRTEWCRPEIYDIKL